MLVQVVEQRHPTVREEEAPRLSALSQSLKMFKFCISMLADRALTVSNPVDLMVEEIQHIVIRALEVEPQT